MSHSDRISDRQKCKQNTVFRLAERDFGQNLKAIAEDSGIGYTTIQSYARGESVMGIASFYKLCGVIDEGLLSLLLPGDLQVVRVPDEIDHDEAERVLASYLRTKRDAHREDSPGGREISECEDRELRAHLVAVSQVGGV